MRRLLLLVACAVLLGCGTMLPAAADDVPPPVFPSGLPSPGSVGNSAGGSTPAPKGPTYVVTPGSKGTALPPPTTALPRSAPVRPAARPAPARRAPASTAVAAGAAAADAPAAANDGSEGKILLAAAGALLMLILTEFTRLDRRFQLHRPTGVR